MISILVLALANWLLCHIITRNYMTGLEVVLVQALFFSISVFISLLFPIGELQIVFINAVVYNNVSKWVGLYFFMPSMACFIYYYSKNYKNIFLNNLLR
jgi:hypothetical protein